MLDDLVAIHQEVMKTTPVSFHRYLFSLMNWEARGLCVLGDRGVGKTTMLCQDLLARYKTADKALYLSADHINVLSKGLFIIAAQYFAYGGDALYIDEVHKSPDWSLEIKNILDTYKNKQVIFSASSSIDLNKSKGDLSRRVVYHRLQGLSFREYLVLVTKESLPSLTLDQVLNDHVAIATSLSHLPILKHFQNYLRNGYYPFFLEGTDDYLSKVHNVIEKVLFEDLAVVYNLKQSTLPILKKILWLIATANGLIPNIDKMSKNLGVARETVYNCLSYLSQSGLLNELFTADKGNQLVRKPGKIYLQNTNLLYAIHGTLKLQNDQGALRETFFVNQVGAHHKILFHDRGDFFVDDQVVIEVGGKNKSDDQIQGQKKAYLAIDGITTGLGIKIPLYLFGFLY